MVNLDESLMQRISAVREYYAEKISSVPKRLDRRNELYKCVKGYFCSLCSHDLPPILAIDAHRESNEEGLLQRLRGKRLHRT